MPFIELNQQLHPLHGGQNLLANGPEADLKISGLGAGQQVTICVERAGALVWAVGDAQVKLNGLPIAQQPVALRHGDQLILNGATAVYLDQSPQTVVQPAAVALDSTIPMGATVPMGASPMRAAASANGPVDIGSSGRARPPMPVNAGQAQPQVGQPGAPEPESKQEEIVAVLRKLPDGPAYMLGQAGFRIGREKRCDLVIADRAVSRLHAEIAYSRGQYLLRDLGRGGTKVNGKKIGEPHKLRVGDIVQIGGSEFAFARRPASAEELVRPGEVTPVLSAVEEAPTMIALKKRSSGNGLTWFLILFGAAAALAIYLT